jgi:two-component sensor histidine kinase
MESRGLGDVYKRQDSLIAHALDLSPRMDELKIARTGEISSLDPRIATPLALVMTELIHNALEHGLVETGSGLHISIDRQGKECVIEISDDGVGLPSDFDISTSSNLGLQIVRTLTENELKGSIELKSTKNSTVAKLKFPL